MEKGHPPPPPIKHVTVLYSLDFYLGIGWQLSLVLGSHWRSRVGGEFADA